MTWKYTVVLRNDEYGLVEEYHDDDGKSLGWTQEFMTPTGESHEELIRCLKMMLNDAEKSDVYVEAGDKLIKEFEYDKRA